MTASPSLSTTRLRFTVTVFSAILCAGRATQADDYPLIPGVERFHAESAKSAEAGRVLLNELRCAACHDGLPKAAHPRSAPNLQDIGNRVRPDAIQAIIANPHVAKPGTLMPSMLDALPETERKQAAEAITHFLVGDNILVDTLPGGIVRGEKLFHQVGCVACHQPQREGAATIEGSVPLAFVEKKYTVGSLTAFLKNPHAARPSGRMPNLNLTDAEAADIAGYLLRDIKVPANLTYKYYEGGWQKLPDFDSMEPRSAGAVTGFDLEVAGRKDNFGIVFEGFLQIAKEGDYQFEIASDDGSQLLIDGTPLITNDGVHPMSRKQGRRQLSKGPHALRLEFFEAGGGEELDAKIKAPGGQRQDLAGFVTSTKTPVETDGGFKWQAELAKQGQLLFAKHNCASCHDVKRNDTLVGTPTKSIRLPSRRVAGCVAAKPPANVPNFHLSADQRESLIAASQAPPPAASPIASTMLTFNCYACHARNKIGGVERVRNDYFKTTIPEMGDEGRVPPPLDGVGDKLNSAWLKHVMDNGANDRPYMLTRMPKFGSEHVGAIVDAFAKADRREEVSKVTFKEPIHRVKGGGRLLVGGDGLSCMKCHYFGKYKAPGLQALGLQTMTRRLRKDWFHRYLLDPQAYRPGTRMPQAWPNGKVIMKNVLDGTAATQVEAIWTYLADGDKASIPAGMVVGKMELKPFREPVIYRNFITGLSPRGIAIGNPEKAHYAWDATDMSLALIWHGAFIDAAKHWTGRGQGPQEPLGDNRVSLVRGIPLASLNDLQADTWPDVPESVRFRGYKLNDAGQPTFNYTIGETVVADFIKPVREKPFPWLERTITVKSANNGQPDGTWYFRAATGDVKQLKDDTYLINNAVEMTFPGSKPMIREIKGSKELLVPVTSKVVQHIRW